MGIKIKNKQLTINNQKMKSYIAIASLFAAGLAQQGQGQ